MSSKASSPIQLVQNAYNASQVGLWTTVLGFSILHIVKTGTYNILREDKIFDLILWAQTLQDLNGHSQNYQNLSFDCSYPAAFPIAGSLGDFPSQPRRNSPYSSRAYSNDQSPYAPLAVFAWCFAEIIRFSNYLNDSFDWRISILKVLRHNAFLVLYPVGVTGEFLSLIRNYDEVNKYVKRHFNFRVGEVETGPLIITFLKFYPYILWAGLGFMYYTLYQARSKFYRGMRKPTPEVELSEMKPRESSPKSKKPKRE